MFCIIINSSNNINIAHIVNIISCINTHWEKPMCSPPLRRAVALSGGRALAEHFEFPALRVAGPRGVGSLRHSPVSASAVVLPHRWPPRASAAAQVLPCFTLGAFVPLASPSNYYYYNYY